MVQISPNTLYQTSFTEDVEPSCATVRRVCFAGNATAINFFLSFYILCLTVFNAEALFCVLFIVPGSLVVIGHYLQSKYTY